MRYGTRRIMSSSLPATVGSVVKVTFYRQPVQRRGCRAGRSGAAYGSTTMTRALTATLILLAADGFLMGNGTASPPRTSWRTLSSARGELPVPGPSTQQTGAVVADFDKDGVNDFVLSFREKPPALVWYRRAEGTWMRQVIEPAYLTVEAGGAVHDIDGDGDLDIVFGGDWQSAEVWWWENPYPDFNAAVPWVRHTIKSGGATQHHDQVFGDFLGTGTPQLAFWNQGAKSLLVARIPPDPRRLRVGRQSRSTRAKRVKVRPVTPRALPPRTWTGTAPWICSPGTPGSSTRGARASGRSGSASSAAASPSDASGRAPARKS